MNRPLHSRVLGRGRRLAAFRIGGAVVEHIVSVNTPLVRTALVLHHGGLATEATTGLVGIPWLSSIRSLTSSDNRHGRTCTASCPCGFSGGAQDSMTFQVSFISVESEAARDTHVREAFSAPKVCALMGFLPGVRSDVNCECAPLDETLPAARRHTRVGPLIGMYPVVTLQVRLSVKALKSSMLAISSLDSSIRHTHLVARIPIALEGTSGRLVLN